MAPSIYLINPRSDFPTYYGAEVYEGWGLRPVTLMADLVMPTLAGMLPDDFQRLMCDENISPVDYDAPVDYVAITGKITQSGRMSAIAAEFRRRGKTVLIGGPFASLSPEAMRPHCDILVIGEIENLAEQLFADLKEGTWKEEYRGDRPDLDACSLPDWSLYPNGQALMGTVQTSRGCPFECEFCDVIQYLGRNQRHKPVSHVLAELDAVYRYGYRSVFLADDNFTVYRSRAKELLTALRAWNARQEQGKVRFLTQVSIDAARDEELLRMCAEAGLTSVFIGIETPNEASLKEAGKRQNLKIDLVEQVERFLHYGIAVSGGMIVGFDSDGPDIFDRQYTFAMASPIPVFSLGALVAPAATPLHARMASQGRLVQEGSEVAAMPWSTNIVPRLMTQAELLDGIQGLCNRLYRPAAFTQRILNFMERMGDRRDPGRGETLSPLYASVAVQQSWDLLGKLINLGPDEARMWSTLRTGLTRNPEMKEFVLPMVLQYLQIRYMYQQGHFWESRVSYVA